MGPSRRLGVVDSDQRRPSAQLPEPACVDGRSPPGGRLRLTLSGFDAGAAQAASQRRSLLC